MANWNGTARSNYFKVKDEFAFEDWVESIGCQVLADREGRYGFAPDDFSDDGDFPSQRYDEETGDGIDIDVEAEIVQHLAEGEVCVLMIAGAEKLRYITGAAIAIAWDGRITRLYLNQIYEKAEKKFGVRPSPAEY